MKTLKVNFYLAAILLATSIFGISSCQQDEVMEFNFSDDPYLNFKAPADQSLLTGTDLNILMEGFQRLNVQHNKEVFLVPTLSAQEANLSEELYAYLMQMIDYTNSYYSDDFISRTKTRSEEDGFSGATDCLAHALAYALGGNYSDINKYITDEYGTNGVPSGKFNEVMTYFNDKGEEVSLDTFKATNISFEDSQGSTKYIIVIGDGHAVNVE